MRYSIERTYITSGLAHQWAVLALGDSHGSIKSSTIENNGTVSYGIRTNTNTVPATPVEVLVEDSIIQGHNYGVYSDATGGSVSNVSLSNSQLLANSHAIETSHGGTVALVSSRIAYNGFGVTISTLGGPVYTDGRNWFGYNFGDLNGGATLTGPAGIR